MRNIFYISTAVKIYCRSWWLQGSAGLWCIVFTAGTGGSGVGYLGTMVSMVSYSYSFLFTIRVVHFQS